MATGVEELVDMLFAMIDEAKSVPLSSEKCIIERDRALEALEGVDAYICTSNPFDIEIMAQGVDKGTGLSQLAAYLSLEPSQVMAVGDSGNDVGMMEFAGVRAVMANGEAELKELADIVTDSNDRDGVAKLLDALVLGQLEPGRQAAGHCLH